MGEYKKRTAFINKKLTETSDQEAKKLLSNGFIPESLRPEYEAFSAETAEDTDLDKISNANHFSLRPEKVGGQIVPGSGFLNPTLTKGTINDAVDAINATLKKEAPTAQKNESPKTTMKTPKSIPSLEETIKNKFKHLSDQQLIDRTNRLPDFKHDDEEFELMRRHKASNGTFNFEMQGNKIVMIAPASSAMKRQTLGQVSRGVIVEYADEEGKIISELESQGEMTTSDAQGVLEANEAFARDQYGLGSSPATIAKKILDKGAIKAKPDDELSPEVDLNAADLSKIKALALVENDERKVKYTVEETLRKYNPNISVEEIKAWVYHKRRFGSPMRGWESDFLSGKSDVKDILLITTKETTIKDNKYVDLRVVPAGTTVGVKTRFKNTYGTDTLVICRTEQGELIWINTADVKEQVNISQASQDQLDKLVDAKALIYDGVEYFPYPVFMFGNIYEKVKLLEENRALIESKYGEEVYNRQIEDCAKFKPKKKSFRDPLKTNRPHILSLSAFANDPIKFGVTALNEETNVKLGHLRRGRFQETQEAISLFDAFVTWMEEAVKDTDLKMTNKVNIKKYYIAKSISWEKDQFGHDVYNSTQKAELIGNARIACEDLFSEFLSSALTFEDSVALDNIWNEKYNAFSNIIQFVDKVPVAYNGSAMFKRGDLDIKPAQRQGLAYLQLTGSGCLAYDVGFGKTMCGILNLAQLISQGAIKRPLIIVPKPTYKNWLKEIMGYWTDGEKVSFTEFKGAVYHYGVLSGTDVKINDWYNLSGDHYKNLLAKNGGDINKLVPENTITVVSYKGFEQMGFSKNISTEMFDSIARVIMQKEATDDPKETAKLYEKITTWLGMGNKNAQIDVDVCGFDHITVDEAHNFKNVFDSCGKDPETKRKLFGISAGQSSRAVKMFFVSNYVQLKHGKNVVLLTATPFTNSPLEIYSMLSFIGLESLNKYNLFNIKKFFEQFVLETIEYAIDAKGEIITKAVIKAFMNLKLLQTILYNHFHYKDDPKEANVVRPCKIDLPSKMPNISTYLEMNDWQRKNQLVVKDMAKSVSRANPGAVLKAINMSLDNAFSPFLFAKQGVDSAEEFIEQSPKIKYVMECIRSVKKWHEQRKEECSGIVMYSNRGKDYFETIKQYMLEDLGFKKKVFYDDEYLDEVEIITGGGSEAEQDRKELIKDAFNAGIVKVIIGTSTIREGVNLQSRGTCLFDMYPEWNPTDVIQLKGRIWRQGNKYGYIRFIMPLVINSMDNFIQQKLDEKSKRISSIWHSLGDSNVSENTSDIDPSEIKMELVDDANEKFKIKHETMVSEVKRELTILEENKRMLSGISGHIESLKENEEEIHGDLAVKKQKWMDYLTLLKTISKVKLRKEKLTKTVGDIEKVEKNLTDLLEAFGNYESNRNDIASLIIVNKMLQQRSWDVFTDASDLGTSIERRIDEVKDWRTFQLGSSWTYKNMIESYSILKKAEKSVLKAYNKSWYDDLTQIVSDINSRVESVTAKEELIQSEEYKQSILDEIEAEMEAKKSIRGDLDKQVSRFASLNHLLSYLSDNTDKEGCPIPEGICCETNGIDVIYQDKDVRHEETMQAPSKQENKEFEEAISTLEMLMESGGTKKQNKEWKEAIETLKMLAEDEVMQAAASGTMAKSEWVTTKDGVSLKKRSNEYAGHVFFDEQGNGYRCMGYFPELDDCVYINLQTGKDTIGCVDGFYYNNPLRKKRGIESEAFCGGGRMPEEAMAGGGVAMAGGNVERSSKKEMVIDLVSNIGKYTIQFTTKLPSGSKFKKGDVIDVSDVGISHNEWKKYYNDNFYDKWEDKKENYLVKIDDIRPRSGYDTLGLSSSGGSAAKGAKAPKGIAKRGNFTIDGETNYKGYTFGNNWNGFEVPYFESEEAYEIVRPLGGRKSYDPPVSLVIPENEEMDQEFAEYKQMKIKTVDGPKTVYPVGAFEWTWSDADSAAGGLKANDLRLGAWLQHKTTGTKVRVWNVDPTLGKMQVEDVYGNKNQMWRSANDWKVTTAPTASGGTMPEEEVYIEFLNKKKNFQKDRKVFKGKDAYQKATKWARANFERFDPDMIKYASASGGKAIITGTKHEMEHKRTIEKIKGNSDITAKDAAQLIAKDHLKENPDYYKNPNV